MKVLRLAAVLAALAGAPLLGGCSNACLAVADQICACLPEDGSRAACKQRAAENARDFPVREADAAHCQALLDQGSCDCHNLNTPEGRLACGLAYPAQ